MISKIFIYIFLIFSVYFSLSTLIGFIRAKKFETKVKFLKSFTSLGVFSFLMCGFFVGIYHKDVLTAVFSIILIVFIYSISDYIFKLISRSICMDGDKK